MFASPIASSREVFIYLLSHFMDWIPIIGKKRALRYFDELSFTVPKQYGSLSDRLLKVLIDYCLESGVMTVDLLEALSSLLLPLTQEEAVPYNLTEISRELPATKGTSSSKELPIKVVADSSKSSPNKLAGSPNELPATKGAGSSKELPPNKFSEYIHIFPFETRESHAFTILMELGLDLATPDKNGQHVTDFIPYISPIQWSALIDRGYDLVCSKHQKDVSINIAESIYQYRESYQIEDLPDSNIRKIAQTFSPNTRKIEKILDRLDPLKYHAAWEAISILSSLQKEYFLKSSLTESLHFPLQKYNERLQRRNECVEQIQDLTPASSWETILSISQGIGMIALSFHRETAFEELRTSGLKLVLDMDREISWNSIISVAQAYEIKKISTERHQAIKQLLEKILIYFVKLSFTRPSWEHILEIANDTCLIEMSTQKDLVIEEIRSYVSSPEYLNQWRIPNNPESPSL